jgi:hypothetical protein
VGGRDDRYATPQIFIFEFRTNFHQKTGADKFASDHFGLNP